MWEEEKPLLTTVLHTAVDDNQDCFNILIDDSHESISPSTSSNSSTLEQKSNCIDSTMIVRKSVNRFGKLCLLKNN